MKYVQNHCLKEIPTMATNSLISSSQPILKKMKALELDDSFTSKKLNRGISRATDNVNLVSKARNEFALEFGLDDQLQYFVETPLYTFMLPDLTVYSDEFRTFLEKDLIETSTLISLEQSGCLNWWAEDGICQRLWPLATSGDGNCLLHAASLGMWGFHDRLLTLRKALHATLSKGSYRDALWRRWRWQQTLLNKEAGLVYCEDEWMMEWQNLLRLSSTEPRISSGLPFEKDCSGTHGIGNDESIAHNIYESLEEIHVLALAHVLRRPIIVVADKVLKDMTGEPLAPIPFGGVYLPLECPPTECHRSPLMLTYDAAHFSALVIMENEKHTDDSTPVIPLTGPDCQLLPIHFAVDPGVDFSWDQLDTYPVSKPTRQEKLGLLHQYLDIVSLHVTKSRRTEDFSHTDNCSGNCRWECNGNCPPTRNDIPLSPGCKKRATKQLTAVAKQFGSVGRSMGKKIKKNLESLARLGRSNSLKETAASCNCRDATNHSEHQSSSYSSLCPKHLSGGTPKFISSAVLHTEKRHEYQEEMIRNYLHTARERFERELRMQTECNEIGKGESVNYTGPFGVPPRTFCDGERYGAGKSHFYTESDRDMFSLVSRMPAMLRPSPTNDRTLYLSKSTFYNDVPSTHLANPKQNPITKTCYTPPSTPKVKRDESPVGSERCRTEKCPNFGRRDRDHLCSECYKKWWEIPAKLRTTRL